MLLSVLLLSLLNSCGLFLQSSGIKNYKLDEKIPRKGLNKYQQDFIYLTKVLEEGFPGLDSTFSAVSRQKMEEEIITVLDQPGKGDWDFGLLSTKYLAQLRNEHSWVSFNNDFKWVYPFAVHFYNNGWYLANTERSLDSLHIGQKIVEINGIETEAIEKKLAAYVIAENRINAQFEIQKGQLYNKPQFLKEIGVITDATQPVLLKLEKGTELELNVKSTESVFELYDVSFQPNSITRFKGDLYNYDVWPEQGYAYLQFNRAHDKVDVIESISSYVKPWLQPMARSYVNRQFKKKKPSKRIAPFYNPKHPVFKNFVWELVDSLNKSGINHLVVDLRYNPGGNLILGKQLLYFLTDQKDLKDFSEYAYTSKVFKNYFPDDYKKLEQSLKSIPPRSLVPINQKNDLFAEITNPESPFHVPPDRPVFNGNVYVLVDSGTGSAAALLTTLFQDNEIGTIIGSSVGNNPIGASTYTPIRLPRTKKAASISSTYLVRPRPELGRYQMPDYWVERSLTDLQKGIDPHLEKVKELVKENHLK